MKHYFPSNGTEGMVFMEMHCQFCTKDSQLRGGKTYCSILSGSMIKGSPVKQWIHDESGHPTCTSFQRLGTVKKNKIRKSEKTLPIFPEELTNFETDILGFKTQQP